MKKTLIFITVLSVAQAQASESTKLSAFDQRRVEFEKDYNNNLQRLLTEEEVAFKEVEKSFKSSIPICNRINDLELEYENARRKHQLELDQHQVVCNAAQIRFKAALAARTAHEETIRKQE